MQSFRCLRACAGRIDTHDTAESLSFQYRKQPSSGAAYIQYSNVFFWQVRFEMLDRFLEPLHVIKGLGSAAGHVCVFGQGSIVSVQLCLARDIVSESSAAICANYYLIAFP